MLMLLRLLVTAFDVFALGTAIYSTSLNYYYRCIGQIYRKPACYVNILNENICFVKAFFDKKSNFVKKKREKKVTPRKNALSGIQTAANEALLGQIGKINASYVRPVCLPATRFFCRAIFALFQSVRVVRLPATRFSPDGWAPPFSPAFWLTDNFCQIER